MNLSPTLTHLEAHGLANLIDSTLEYLGFRERSGDPPAGEGCGLELLPEIRDRIRSGLRAGPGHGVELRLDPAEAEALLDLLLRRLNLAAHRSDELDLTGLEGMAELESVQRKLRGGPPPGTA